MTNYVVSTDVNGSFEVPAGGTNTSTSLVLIGRGASGYGQIVANNTILQLSNFASPNAPATPLKGQIWYDSVNTVIKFYNGAIWSAVAQTSDLLNYAKLADFNVLQSNVAALSSASGNYVTVTQLTNPPNGTAPVAVKAGGTGLTGLGGANTVLAVNSAGTGLTYVDPTTFIPSSANFMHTNSSNAPTTNNAFTLGTSGAVYSNVYSTLFTGTATSANYADLAERYETDMPVEAGDVVMLGGAKEITKCDSAFSTDVFGIVSTAPGYMMNSEAGSDDTHPYIALTGRVPVKVTGNVKKGQRLVSSSIAGVAQAADIADIANGFVVIGRALADKTTDGVGLVEVTVGAK